MSWSKTALSRLFRSKTVSADKVYQTGVVTLADAPTIIIDASQANAFRVTLGGNRTLGIPVNPQHHGQEIVLQLVQDATGSRTLTLTEVGAGSFGFGTLPTKAGFVLSTAAGKIDYVRFRYNATTNKWYVIQYALGF